MLLDNANVNEFTIYYRNSFEFLATYHEVFGDEPYKFSASTSQPFILDCGSHIGTSVLYFKRQYPDARIIAFEPDPGNYAALARNIEANHLTRVTAINAALAECEGTALFYGELDVASPRTLGNSLVEAWANRDGGGPIQVKTVRLSSYINGVVDYLKLDVEGMEGRVLQDIRDKLPLVREMCIEFHGLATTAAENNLETIVALLEASSFHVQVTHRDIKAFLPDDLHEWAERFNPSLAMVRAVNCAQ